MICAPLNRFVSHLLASTAFAVASSAASAAPLPLLRITDLQAAMQKESLRVVDINNAGQVLSHQDDGPAYLWQPGTQVREITLANASLVPAALNDAGQIAGWAYSANTDTMPFIWDPVAGGKRLKLGAGLRSAEAHAMNIHGQVAGHGVSSSVHKEHLAVGSARLGVVDPRPKQRGRSHGEAINAAGDVGGSASSAEGGRTAILVVAGGQVRHLGGLAGPGERQSSSVLGLNDQGEAVGTSDVNKMPHAFYWSEASGMVDLGMSPNVGDWSHGGDINAHGQIVGGYGNPSHSSTFYWDAEHGGINLNDRLDPSDPLTARTVIIAPNNYARINDHGQIITSAKIDGHYREVLLTPVQP